MVFDLIMLLKDTVSLSPQVSLVLLANGLGCVESFFHASSLLCYDEVRPEV